MTARPVHLARRRTPHGIVAACGARVPRVTRNPAEVTCKSCKRTLAMADAEAHAAYQRSRRGQRFTQ